MELLAAPPVVTVFVYPSSTTAHPTVPPGWRWQVQIGGAPPSKMEACANGGWCPTEQEAQMTGEQNAATAVYALRILGVPATSHVQRLGHDPVPPACGGARFLAFGPAIRG